jgi:hypothetical protein
MKYFTMQAEVISITYVKTLITNLLDLDVSNEWISASWLLGAGPISRPKSRLRSLTTPGLYRNSRHSTPNSQCTYTSHCDLSTLYRRVIFRARILNRLRSRERKKSKWKPKWILWEAKSMCLVKRKQLEAKLIWILKINLHYEVILEYPSTLLNELPFQLSRNPYMQR